MELDINNIALIVSIESNNYNLNLQTKTISIQRFYEDEAIRCFTAWRKNGGWLKNIPIYCVCPSKNYISQKTQNELKKLNIEYIQYYDDNIINYSSGFLTLPFIGKLFETKLHIDQDILIRIDLDMQLLKPLSPTLFSNIDNTTVVGQYDQYSIKDQRSTYHDFLPFDTGFMITNKNNNFCTTWYELCFSPIITSTKEWKFTKFSFGEYYLEEFVIDYMFANKIANITPVPRYQIGEGYASIDTFTDNELDNIYFLHEHLYVDKKKLITAEYNSVYERMTYLKRIKK